MLLSPKVKSLIMTGLDEEIVDFNVWFPLFVILGFYLYYFTGMYGRSSDKETV